MATPIAFESSHVKKLQREQTRKDRQTLLDKAKDDFERNERRKAKQKALGEGTWMLSAVNDRIESENKALEKVKSKKKKEKKKHKKDKKHKKKKHKSTNSDSDSDDDDAVWVEKLDKKKQTAPQAVIGPKLERDSWMTAPPDFFPSVSREELRAEKRKEKGDDENLKEMEEQIGQHERELNPYWKDGGTGLPEEDPSRKITASSGRTAMPGDGGVGWWRKAYQRCVEQASEDGRPLEEIAAERYGSLQELEKLLAAAEESAKQRNQERTRSIRERTNNRERYQISRSRERAGQSEATKMRRSGGRNNSEERHRSWSRDSHGKRKRDDAVDREFDRTENRKQNRTVTDASHRHRSRSDSGERSKNRSDVRGTSRHHRSSSSSSSSNDSSDRNLFKRRRSRSGSRDGLNRRKSRSGSRDRSSHRRSRSRSRQRTKRRSSSNDSRDRHEHRRQSYSKEKSRRPNRSDSRDRFRRRRSDSRERSGVRRGTGRERSKSRERNDPRNRLVESKPFPPLKTSLSKMKFLKPTDDDDISVSASRSYRDKVTSGSGKTTPGWRKKTFLKPDDTNREDKEKIPTKKHYKKSKQSDSDSESSSCSSGSSSSSSRSPVRRDSRSRDASAKVRSKENKDSSPSGSSSSSADGSEDEGSEEDKAVMASPPRVLSDQEMNKLGADLVRAEIMGDTALAQTLTAKMEAARKAKTNPPASSTTKEVAARKTTDDKDEDDEDVVVLTRTDKSGMVRPLPDRQHPVESKHGRRKKKKVKTHTSTGERERYFDDDDRRDLKTMVAEEKLGTAEDQDLMFARLAGRAFEKTDDEYQMDDVMLNRASTIQSQSRVEDRERHMAVLEHKKMSSAMEKCNFCFENVPKHLIIAIGVKVYLCLPYHKSLTDGHCFIVPMHHVTQATAIDEDVWHEIQVFRKGLTKMFEAMDEDCVFMETSMRLNKFPHMVMECIPMPRETGDMAPIYFKKAILDSGTEWDQNKKLVSLSEKNIRRAVPKGFPYFSVDFGLQGGFAHVIENETTFPHYFGREIIGGIMDLEPGLWRKPGRENFETQRLKVLQFAEWWKPYDWTQKLKDETN